MKSFASSKVDEKFLNVPVVSPSVSNAGSRFARFGLLPS